MENVTDSWFEAGKKKRAAGWAVIVLMALGAFLTVKTINEIKSYAFIGRTEVPQNIITVTGTGDVLAVPDIATFNFSVREEAPVVKDAQNKAATKTNQAIAFLEQKGISDKDYKVTGYNIYPRYEYREKAGVGYTYPSGERYLAGYEVSQTIEVKVRSIEDAGDILSGIGEIGVSEVSGLSFSNDMDEELRKEAREKAIAEAREDAKNLARALGVSLGRIVNFSESGNYPVPMYYKASLMADGRGGGESVAPDINPGENKITSSVSITYEIR